MSEDLVGQRIQIKRSNTAPSDMRGLFDGEFGYVKDTNKLYIGKGAGNDPVQVNVTDNATTTTAGLMSAADKTKLDGATTKAFSNIQVGSTVIAADSNADTFTMVAGSNVTLIPDQTNDKVTIAATDTGATTVTVTGSGNAITTASYDASTRTITLDKGATYNNYSLPQAGSSLGGIKTGGVATVSGGQITAISKATSATTASKVSNSLTVGTKTYNGSAAVEIVASDLGLSNAMHFRGVVSSLPANTTGYVDGDVILVGNKEYVCSNSAWIELGDESSFALKNHTHNYAGSSSVGGAATSANKVNSALSIQLNSGTATTFNGSAAKSINITPAAIGAATSGHNHNSTYVNVTGDTMTGNLEIQGTNPYIGFKNSSGTTVGYVQYVEDDETYGIGQSMVNSLVITNTGSITIPDSQTFTPRTTNTGSVGTSNYKWNAMYATTFNGNATSATKVNKNLIVKLNGGATEGTNLFTFNGSTAKTVDITPSAIGAAASSHGTHVSYGTSATAIGATAAAGSAATVSRSDHTHSLSKSAVTTALGYTPPTTNTTYSVVTSSAAGLAPAYGTDAAGTIDSNSTDWVLTYNNGSIGWYKLPANAFNNTVYTHPAGNAASKASGLYKFSTNATSHINGVTAVTKADITALGIPAQDTTYGVMGAATSSAAGTSGLVPAPAAGKQSSFLRGDGTWATPTNTKNTAGSTNSSSKLFLIGATSQATNPTTYSHDTAYVGTDGCLYSNSTKVSVVGHTHTLTPSNKSIYQITGVGTMFTATVSGEVLTLTAGSVPTRSSVSVMTGVSIAASTT